MTRTHSTAAHFACLPPEWRAKLEVDPVTGCWNWVGKWNSGNGYGKLKLGGRAYMAHRAIYEFLTGEPIPDGLLLDHVKERCAYRSCCNPDHLEPVSVAVNTHRGRAILFQCKAA